MPSHSHIYTEGYPRSRGPYFARAPSFQHEQAPQSPRPGPPPEYAPPRWYDHQHSRDQIWQPPPSGNRGRIAHRFSEAEAAYHFPLRRRHMQHVTETPPSQEPWTVPKPKSQERKSNAVLLAEKNTTSAETPDGKEEGDSLSMLAKVSSSMAPPHKRKLMQQQQQQLQQRNEENESEDPEDTGERTNSPSAATPRGTRASGDTSPIQHGKKFYGPGITPYNMTKTVPVSVNVVPKPITPTGHPANYHPFHAQHRPPQHYSGTLYMEERGPRYYGPPSQPRSAYSSGPSAIHHFYHPGSHPPPTPQLSNYSFGDSWISPKNERSYYSQYPAVVERNSFDSSENPLNNIPHPESEGYWQPPFPSVSPCQGRYDGTGTYLPPRWSHEGQVPLAYPRHLGPPHPHMEEHIVDGDRFPGSRNFAPYSYVQQPNLESKTLLRKKFSWKNYPALERFLIENREEYLEHSSRNYTVAQKQYNNMLTERLLEVAEKAGYAFDQDEFNFVSIRDRIRCYYKSYVQTVRKRGLPLPGSVGNKKKRKTFNADEGDHGDEDEEEAEENSLENGQT